MYSSLLSKKRLSLVCKLWLCEREKFYIFVIKIIVDCLLRDPRDVVILGELLVNNFLCHSSIFSAFFFCSPVFYKLILSNLRWRVCQRVCRSLCV